MVDLDRHGNTKKKGTSALYDISLVSAALLVIFIIGTGTMFLYSKI